MFSIKSKAADSSSQSTSRALFGNSSPAGAEASTTSAASLLFPSPAKTDASARTPLPQPPFARQFPFSFTAQPPVDPAIPVSLAAASSVDPLSPPYSCRPTYAAMSPGLTAAASGGYAQATEGTQERLASAASLLWASPALAAASGPRAPFSPASSSASSVEPLSPAFSFRSTYSVSSPGLAAPASSGGNPMPAAAVSVSGLIIPSFDSPAAGPLPAPAAAGGGYGSPFKASRSRESDELPFPKKGCPAAPKKAILFASGQTIPCLDSTFVLRDNLEMKAPFLYKGNTITAERKLGGGDMFDAHLIVFKDGTKKVMHIPNNETLYKKEASGYSRKISVDARELVGNKFVRYTKTKNQNNDIYVPCSTFDALKDEPIPTDKASTIAFVERHFTDGLCFISVYAEGALPSKLGDAQFQDLVAAYKCSLEKEIPNDFKRDNFRLLNGRIVCFDVAEMTADDHEEHLSHVRSFKGFITDQQFQTLLALKNSESSW